MEFDVRITFTGLCLYVPNSKNARFHVLLPRTDDVVGHGGRSVRHVAYLGFDEAHDEDAQGGATGTARWIPLNGHAVTVKPKGKLGKTWDPQILRIDHPTKRPCKLKGKNLKDNPHRDVEARVTLRAGGISCCAPTAKWRYHEESNVSIAWQLDWKIVGVKDDLLDLEFERFEWAEDAGIEEHDTLQLRPLVNPQYPDNSTKPVVDLYVYHILHPQLPLRLPPREQPAERPAAGFAVEYVPVGDHFPILYRLFDNLPHGMPGVPELDTTQPTPEGQLDCRGVVIPPVKFARGGEPYTCTGGGGCEDGTC
jgi:hypothetical protein